MFREFIRCLGKIGLTEITMDIEEYVSKRKQSLDKELADYYSYPAFTWKIWPFASASGRGLSQSLPSHQGTGAPSNNYSDIDENERI